MTNRNQVNEQQNKKLNEHKKQPFFDSKLYANGIQNYNLLLENY